ncbi:MAG: NADH-quinone oxidoreductase subunit J [Sphingobacteriales bacterium]|nr:NADH-quinone oxidoreductase subunit J [Sphingobacteriales bacterium]
MMNGSTILFYLLAALTVSCGVLSISTRHIFRAAIYLLFSLIGVAGLYFWLAYEFIAAVQIVVYVGGIVVLIIFSIFLTQQAGEKLPRQRLDRKIWATLATFCGFALTLLQVWQHEFPPVIPQAPVTVRGIGEKMMSTEAGGYALPFEIISMLLLAAMVGCIVIALRSKPETK